MDKDSILREAAIYVRGILEHDSTGHDWWHIYRVDKLAENIAASEGADVFVCRLAAYLHDLADEKLCGDEQAGIASIRSWMESSGVNAADVQHVVDIVSAMSFKGGGRPPMSTLEGRVVQDADRLDAIGAVGIARVFAYAGAQGSIIHDPAIAPREVMTKEQFRSKNGTAINHFYEKLLKLKDLMNTRTAVRLAQERHLALEQYLQRFYAEWEGSC
jgi:uncharacterized protein